jgi:hypothetical protein
MVSSGRSMLAKESYLMGVKSENALPSRGFAHKPGDENITLPPSRN